MCLKMYGHIHALVTDLLDFLREVKPAKQQLLELLFPKSFIVDTILSVLNIDMTPLVF